MVSEPEERFDINSDKQEGLNFLREIGECSTQVCELVKRLKERICQDELPTEKGIGILDVKNQLILQYLSNLTNFMLLKVNGIQIEENPVIDRLIELRVVLERIRPIEQKLKYQIDKFLKMAVTGTVDKNDPSQFKANPSNMLGNNSSEDESEEEEEEGGDTKKKEDKEKKKSGIYVPPKLAAVHYDGDEAERKARALERARKFALSSSLVQELKEEYLDTPTEVATTNSARQTHDRHQKRKQEYEEAYFTRLPVTKEEKRRSKKLSTLGTLGDEVTRFEDISVLQTGILKSTKKRKRGKTNQKGKGNKKRRKK